MKIVPGWWKIHTVLPARAISRFIDLTVMQKLLTQKLRKPRAVALGKLLKKKKVCVWGGVSVAGSGGKRCVCAWGGGGGGRSFPQAYGKANIFPKRGVLPSPYIGLHYIVHTPLKPPG